MKHDDLLTVSSCLWNEIHSRNRAQNSIQKDFLLWEKHRHYNHQPGWIQMPVRPLWSYFLCCFFPFQAQVNVTEYKRALCSQKAWLPTDSRASIFTPLNHPGKMISFFKSRFPQTLCLHLSGSHWLSKWTSNFPMSSTPYISGETTFIWTSSACGTVKGLFFSWWSNLTTYFKNNFDNFFSLEDKRKMY